MYRHLTVFNIPKSVMFTRISCDVRLIVLLINVFNIFLLLVCVCVCVKDTLCVV